MTKIWSLSSTTISSILIIWAITKNKRRCVSSQGAVTKTTHVGDIQHRLGNVYSTEKGKRLFNGEGETFIQR